MESEIASLRAELHSIRSSLAAAPSTAEASRDNAEEDLRNDIATIKKDITALQTTVSEPVHMIGPRMTMKATPLTPDLTPRHVSLFLGLEIYGAHSGQLL